MVVLPLKSKRKLTRKIENTRNGNDLVNNVALRTTRIARNFTKPYFTDIFLLYTLTNQ